MPAPANVDEFLDLIRKSGVVEEARLVGYMQKLRSLSSAPPKEPNKLAGLMVRDAILTYFQAEQFLQGKWKRFTIGKYKVLERLGSGGMGQVFLCEHKLMRRRVAVKVLPTAKAEDPSSLERFQREARVIAALDHQNIVRAYDIDQDDNLHFLVMEFVDGCSFQELIKKSGPMDVLRACHYIYWSAIGMQYAHEQGIIHRDIKPGNILVDRQGVVKILDMGLARFFHDDEDHITKKFDENVLGTADYLAPEQALDSHSVDGRADIYSLGATFYFLLSGGPPFVDGTVAQKLIWHQNREPKALKSVRPDVPDGIANIIAKMMAKDPANRFQTPAELAATLGPWIQTPIAPPPEAEMPTLCPAVLASGTGMVSTTARASTSLTNSGTVPMLRPQQSSVNLGPIPTPPIGSGSSKHPMQMVAESKSTDTVRKVPPPPRVEPLPPPEGPLGPLDNSSVEGEAIPGDAAWEAFTDTNAINRDNTDRKPSSSHKKKAAASNRKKSSPKADTATSKGRLKLWLALGVVVIALAIGLIVMLSGGKTATTTNPNPPVEGPRKIYVSKQHTKDLAQLKLVTIQNAFEVAGPKDQIIILDDEWEEVVAVTSAKKDIVLSPAPGKRVIWRTTDPKHSAVFEIGNAENLRIRGITFNASNVKPSAVRVKGACSGLVMEDVELVDAKEISLNFVDCQGDSSRPVRISKVRMIGNANTLAAINFTGSSSKKEGSKDGPTAWIRIENCRIEGPFKVAAIQVEGQVSDIDFLQNRIWNVSGGIFVKKTAPEQLLKLTFANNTLHTVGGPLLRFESAETLAAPPNTGKHKFEFNNNYLFNATAPLVAATDAKPLPKIEGANNARNTPTPDGAPDLPIPTVIDLPQFPVEPKDDATFLRSDVLKTAGPNKKPVGASGP